LRAITKVAKFAGVVKAQSVARHKSINTTMISVHEADQLDNPGVEVIEYNNGGEMR